MRYLLMIYTAESVDEAMSEAEMGTLMAGYYAFGTELEQAGGHLGSERLRPVADATTVQVRKGATTVTDGPFAETKEQLGGYYLIEAADIDAAIAWAKKIPSVEHGRIEIRPVWEMEG